MNEQGFEINSTSPKVNCKVFEENFGTIEIASIPKAIPRTKHLNQRFLTLGPTLKMETLQSIQSGQRTSQRTYLLNL